MEPELNKALATVIALADKLDQPSRLRYLKYLLHGINEVHDMIKYEFWHMELDRIERLP